MKKRLDDRYFELFCDIFDDAKEKLLSDGKRILGMEYEETYDKLVEEKKILTNMRISFSESKEMVALKDELTLLKERLIECADENEKIVIRSEMDELLKTIAKKNIENFGVMSKKKRELDALAKKLQSIVDEKKELLESAEKELFTEAKTRFATIVSSYKEESDALKNAFGIFDENDKLPFSEWIDLNMRLIDFDRKKLKEERERKDKDISACAKCPHSCGEKGLSEKKYFTCSEENGDKN